MNAGSASSGAVPAQNAMYKHLVRPELITTLPFLDANSKSTYVRGSQNLWQTINEKPPDSEEHKSAVNKLTEFTGMLQKRNRIWQASKQQAQQAQQSGQQRFGSQGPSSQGQETTEMQKSPQPLLQTDAQSQTATAQQPQPTTTPAQTAQNLQMQTQSQQNLHQSLLPDQQMQRQMSQQPQSLQAPAGTAAEQLQQPGLSAMQMQQMGDVPQVFKLKAESIPWIPPPNMEDASLESWTTEVRSRYARALYGKEVAQNHIIKLDQMIGAMRAQGKEITAELLESKAKNEQQYLSHKHFIEGMHKQQEGRKRTNVAGDGNFSQIPPQGQVHGSTLQSQQQPQQHTQQHLQQQSQSSQSQPQQSTLASSSTSHASPNLANINNLSHTATARPQPLGMHGGVSQAGLQAQQQIPTNSQSQAFNITRPQINPNQTSSFVPAGMQQPRPQQMPGSFAQSGVQALTHDTAIAAVRSHSIQNINTLQSNPQSGTPMSYRHESEKANNKQLPINKSFVPVPPQPVSMGPSRPTLIGNSSGAMGMIGQPAIQKTPTYLLQGPGNRVLDKKKLDELVRQVTGGGEGSDSLQPDVEEVSISNAGVQVKARLTDICA